MNETPKKRFAFLKSTLLRSTETLLSIVLVLVCFLGFMGILSLSFPQGTSLQDLILRPTLPDSLNANVDIDWVGDEDEEPPGPLAWLAETERIVKDKRSNAITWSTAHRGTALNNRHSVQTYARSGARIRFDNGDDMTLGENSLIVIRNLERQASTRSGTASMILMDGELSGLSGILGQAPLETEIMTGSGVSMFIPKDQRDARYNVKVNPDETSTFSVYKGRIKVRSAGESVTVKANQTVTVTPSEPPGLPIPLPSTPALMTPSDGTTYTSRNAPPRIGFEWKGETVDMYRLVISRDPTFNDVVYDEKVNDPEVVHGNLPPGRYFWRVSGLSGWAEGLGSVPRRLEVIRDDVPPHLAVKFPGDVVRGDAIEVRGQTEPNALVFIGDESVSADQKGEFEHLMTLQRGLNVLVVEAVDAAGNIAYQSKLVSARF